MSAAAAKKHRKIGYMEIFKEIISILFGTDNGNSLRALVILVAIDYVTGVCVAIRKHELSSEIGAKGIAGKVMIFALVALSNVADTCLQFDSTALGSITILFYCANESISIIENAGRMGVPLPKKLIRFMTKLQEKSD